MTRFPLIEGYTHGAALGLRDGRTLSAGGFVAAARGLAARLPQADCGLLLCEDRLAFAIGFAAMLMRNATALLPPSHAPQALAKLARSRGPAFALVDRAGVATGLPEIIVDPRAEQAADERVPSIDGGHIAVIAYTSGTTGDPQAYPKTWSSLVRGAWELRTRIGFVAGDTVVGAVPPQHMWGLEATVMLPLQAGGVIEPHCPLLPEDIVAALAGTAPRRWLVLTPLHVRSCLRSTVPLPQLAGTLCATTPLDAEFARAFEERTHGPMIEAYGATEAGIIGTREPTRDERFTPLEGLVATPVEAGLEVRGGHVETPVIVRDRALVSADGRFTLAGRDADLVKVGGKRASLAMLERELNSIAGVVDGAFVAIETGGLSPRLAALVVAPSVERETLLAALRERIDPVFLPRPFYRVDALPRNPLGKLSRETLRARVAELAAAGSPGVAVRPLTRRLTVNAPQRALAGHFPGRPIVPAAWLMTLIEATCHDAYGVSVRGAEQVRFRTPVTPDMVLDVELEPRAEGRIAFSLRAGATRVADGVLATRAP